MIGKLVETPVVRRARYLFVGVLYVVLMLAVGYCRSVESRMVDVV